MVLSRLRCGAVKSLRLTFSLLDGLFKVPLPFLMATISSELNTCPGSSSSFFYSHEITSVSMSIIPQ